MKQFFMALLMGFFAVAGMAQQNRVVIEKDTVYIANEQNQRVAVKSAEIKARVDEYDARRKELADLIALNEKLAAMKEQAFRMRDEQEVLNNLFKEVAAAEAKLPKK